MCPTPLLGLEPARPLTLSSVWLQTPVIYSRVHSTSPCVFVCVCVCVCVSGCLIFKPLERCWVIWGQGAGRPSAMWKPFPGLHFPFLSRKGRGEEKLLDLASLLLRVDVNVQAWGWHQVSLSTIFYFIYLFIYLFIYCHNISLWTWSSLVQLD